MNCGACGVACNGATPYCNGSCKATPCFQDAPACDGGSCCGTLCCTQGQICCAVGGGGPPHPNPNHCYTPTPSQPTCEPGCVACR
jgi:hypothetical protein